MRKARLGRPCLWKGKKLSEKWRENLSKAHLGHKLNEKQRQILLFNATGSKNNNWKGGVSKDPAYVAWSKNRWHHRNRSAPGSHTNGEWEDLKAKYDWQCPACKRREPEIKLGEDHIVPLSKGGSNNIENIQPLCRSCNCRKQTKTIRY